MVLELQHFIYSLYPKQGYGVVAASPNVDKQQWKAFCAPPPVERQDLETPNLNRVWALQKVGGDVIISMFAAGIKDEYDRPGIYSHNILISVRDYINIVASPTAFIKHFIFDPNLVGELPPLTINLEDLKAKVDFELLRRVRPNTLEKVLVQVLKGSVVTLACPGRDTEQMVALVSALCELLPPGARIVSFITAPLSRVFRRERGSDRYKLKLVQNCPLSLVSNEECIDVDQDYQAPMMLDEQSKSVHYLVNEFYQQGYQGISPLHKIWELGETEDSMTISAQRFVAAYEVEQELVSIESLKAMLRKGKRGKEEAKRYAAAMLDTHKWKNTAELAEIFTILVQGSTEQALKQDILRLIKATESVEPSERFDIYECLIGSLPQARDELFLKLRDRYGDNFILQLHDLQRYPEISSRVLSLPDYATFESMSRKLLQGSVSDSRLFEWNLRYLMDKVRKQFGEQTLDFVQQTLVNFPGYKSIIAQQIEKEDLIPTSLISHLSKGNRQRFLTQAEKIKDILKSILSP